jgi:hypothetical protein
MVQTPRGVGREAEVRVAVAINAGSASCKRPALHDCVSSWLVTAAIYEYMARLTARTVCHVKNFHGGAQWATFSFKADHAAVGCNPFIISVSDRVVKAVDQKG